MPWFLQLLDASSIVDEADVLSIVDDTPVMDGLSTN
jgi:hypothetical protein